MIRATFDRNQKKYEALLKALAKKATKDPNLSPKRQLEILGEKIRSDMIATIDRSIDLEPLKPATIARKGSSKPLLDTGQMKQAIQWKIK